MMISENGSGSSTGQEGKDSTVVAGDMMIKYEESENVDPDRGRSRGSKERDLSTRVTGRSAEAPHIDGSFHGRSVQFVRSPKSVDATSG